MAISGMKTEQATEDSMWISIATKPCNNCIFKYAAVDLSNDDGTPVKVKAGVGFTTSTSPLSSSSRTMATCLKQVDIAVNVEFMPVPSREIPFRIFNGTCSARIL